MFENSILMCVSEMLNLQLRCQSGGEMEDEGMQQRAGVKIRDSEGLGRIG